MEEEFEYNEITKKWEFKYESMNKDYNIELTPQYDNQGLIWAHWPKKVRK